MGRRSLRSFDPPYGTEDPASVLPVTQVRLSADQPGAEVEAIEGERVQELERQSA